MQTWEEIEMSLPPAVSAVMGCAAFNEQLEITRNKIRGAFMAADSRIKSLPHDDNRGRYEAELPFLNALAVFMREVAQLEKERRRIMFEPEPGAQPTDKIEWNTSSLRVTANTPDAIRWNKRVSAFCDRRLKALKFLHSAATTTTAAWTYAISEGKPHDAETAAKNKAERALAEAARPFIQEHKQLIAERAKRFGK